MPAQLVITLGLGRRLDAQVRGALAVYLVEGMSRIVIPFADRESAEAAAAELTVTVDMVTEDFGPVVIQGTVIGDDHDHDQQLGNQQVEALPAPVVLDVLPGDGPG